MREKFEDSVCRDAFNLICGDKLGSGQYRTVFQHRFDPDKVVKVDNDADDFRFFGNLREMQFWRDHEHHKPTARWLAPCHWLSPNGLVLVQTRVVPISARDVLPKTLPAFLTDVKRENFGWIGKQLVCIDYATTIPNASLKLRKADWDD